MNDVRSLVDVERGLVSRSIFHDAEIYALEQERIFGRCWLFLAHEGQLRNPGDYITCRMGETPVIVARAADGTIHALINSCRHRGNPVTRADAGNARTFTCPYHGWCYDNQGKRVAPGTLVGVPGHDTYYHDRLDFRQWGLVPVAQVDTYRGLIFGTLDPQAPPLHEYLGEFRWFLDAVLGRGVLDVVPGVVRWQVRCNWKFAADNAIGDNSHGWIAHRSGIMAMAQLRGRPAETRAAQDPGFTLLGEYGHGANCKTGFAQSNEDAALQLRTDPVYERWRRDPAIVAKLEPRQQQIQRYNANIFPNLHLLDRLFVVRNPIGPGLTEMRAIALYDTSGSEEEQLAEKRFAFQRFGPTGFYEQEDGENWDQSTSAAAISPLQEHDLHYGMGLGMGEFVSDGTSPSRIDVMVNEHGQRWFYRFWADALRASGWQELRERHLRPVGRF